MREGVLDRVRDFLQGLTAPPGEQPDDTERLRIARTALMFRVIDADGKVLDEERDALRDMLARTYGLDGNGVDDLVRLGQHADHGATDLYEHTSLIRRTTDMEEREHLVEILFELAYADEELHEGEDATVKRISDLLGVEPRARVLARKNVADRHGLSTIAKGG